MYPSKVWTGTSLTEQLVLFMTKIVHYSFEMNASLVTLVMGPYNLDRKFSRTTNIEYGKFGSKDFKPTRNEKCILSTISA